MVRDPRVKQDILDIRVTRDRLARDRLDPQALWVQRDLWVPLVTQEALVQMGRDLQDLLAPLAEWDRLDLWERDLQDLWDTLEL